MSEHARLTRECVCLSFCLAFVSLNELAFSSLTDARKRKKNSGFSLRNASPPRSVLFAGLDVFVMDFQFVQNGFALAVEFPDYPGLS